MTIIPKLPRYECFKQVRAAPIVSMKPIRHVVDGVPRDDWTVTVDSGPPEKGFDYHHQHILVPGDTFARGTPYPGDMLVIYGDGQWFSWSPRKVFDEGYRRIPDDAGLGALDEGR